MEPEKWFAVQSVFLIGAGEILPDRGQMYEDRITLWAATTAEEAVERAQVESDRYARENGYEQVDFLSTYALFDPPGDGAEVWSIMRDSWLAPEDYIRRFVDEEAAADG